MYHVKYYLLRTKIFVYIKFSAYTNTVCHFLIRSRYYLMRVSSIRKIKVIKFCVLINYLKEVCI